MKKIIFIILLIFVNRIYCSEKKVVRVYVSNYGDTIFYKSEPKIIRLKAKIHPKNSFSFYIGEPKKDFCESFLLHIKNKKTNVITTIKGFRFFLHGIYFNNPTLKFKNIIFDLNNFCVLTEPGDYSIKIECPTIYKFNTDFNRKPKGYIFDTNTLFVPINIKILEDNDTKLKETKYKYNSLYEYYENNGNFSKLKIDTLIDTFYFISNYLNDAYFIIPKLKTNKVYIPKLSELSVDIDTNIRKNRIARYNYELYYRVYCKRKTNVYVLNKYNYKSIKTIRTIIKNHMIYPDTYVKYNDINCTFVFQNIFSDTMILDLGRYNFQYLYVKIQTPDNKIIELYPTTIERLKKIEYSYNHQLKKDSDKPNYGRYYFQPGEIKNISFKLSDFYNFDKIGVYRIWLELRPWDNLIYDGWQKDFPYMTGFNTEFDINITKYKIYDKRTY